MSNKKHELLLVCIALSIIIVSMLYSVIDLSKYDSFYLNEQTKRSYMTYPPTTAEYIQSVNINTADADELMQLDDIGEKKAQAIIEYRTNNGKFNSPEEITEVYGIGIETYQKNINRITV